MPELAAAHIVLDTLTLPATLQRETLIDRMVMPPRVKIGEPFPVRVVVSSLGAQSATVTLAKDGKPTGETKRVELHPGKNVVVFEQNIDKAGFSRYSATLNAPEDTIAENNRGEGFVWVQGKPTVLQVYWPAVDKYGFYLLPDLRRVGDKGSPEDAPPGAPPAQP